MYVHICVHINIYLYTCIYKYIYIHTYLSQHIYINLYIYIYTYIYSKNTKRYLLTTQSLQLHTYAHENQIEIQPTENHNLYQIFSLHLASNDDDVYLNKVVRDSNSYERNEYNRT
jgi:hypothetical protein